MALVDKEKKLTWAGSLGVIVLGIIVLPKMIKVMQLFWPQVKVVCGIALVTVQPVLEVRNYLGHFPLFLNSKSMWYLRKRKELINP